MTESFVLRVRAHFLSYPAATLLLAALPVTVAFGSLAALHIKGMQATATDALVWVLTVTSIAANRRERRADQTAPRHNKVARTRAVETAPERCAGWGTYRWLIVAVMALLGLMVLSAWWATDRFAAVKEILKWVEALMVLLAAPKYLHEARGRRLVLGSMLVAALVEAGLGIVQGTLLTGMLHVSADRGVRVVGTFGQPNPYAGYLDLTLPLLLAGAAWAKQTRTRLWCASAALFVGLALALAQSRGATVALGGALLAMAWLGWPQTRRGLASIFAGMSAACLLALATGRITLAALLERLGWRTLTNADLSTHITDANFSTIERLAHWAAAERMLAAHPWTGVGIGNYATAYSEFAVPRWPLALSQAHNLYLNMLAELGILGGLLYLVVVVLSLWMMYPRAPTEIFRDPPWNSVPSVSRPFFASFRARFRVISRSRPRSWTQIGLFGVAVALVLHNLFDDMTTHSMLVQWMLVLACSQTPLLARLNKGSTKDEQQDG